MAKFLEAIGHFSLYIRERIDFLILPPILPRTSTVTMPEHVVPEAEDDARKESEETRRAIETFSAELLARRLHCERWFDRTCPDALRHYLWRYGLVRDRHPRY